MKWYEISTYDYDGLRSEVPIHLGNYMASNKGEAKAKCKKRFQGYCHPINQLGFSDMVAKKLDRGKV